MSNKRREEIIESFKDECCLSDNAIHALAILLDNVKEEDTDDEQKAVWDKFKELEGNLIDLKNEFETFKDKGEKGDDDFDIDTIIKEDKVLNLIHRFGGIDGAHHKQWVLDQVVRLLTGEKYSNWVKRYEDGEDGPNSYKWDEGITP